MSKSEKSSNTWLKLLTPGLRIKRWLIALIGGAACMGVALTLFLLELNVFAALNISRWVQILTGFLLGVLLVTVGIIRLNQAVLEPLRITTPDMIETMLDYRQRQHGPVIVAIGGGTGLPTLLKGLKAHTTNLTAIVTVADDGGSSGKLRRDLGVLPPGDFRNNIAALARDEDMMARLFQYRFGNGGLDGHSFGNLFITALGSITGSFEEALAESSRVLAIQGRVLPSTLADVNLTADMRDESNSMHRVTGESIITKTAGQIERVYLQPDHAQAYPPTVKAILNADIIVLGPGSLFTSILPNLLVKGITDALHASRALKIYVCNVATQQGETDAFDVFDHVRVIEQHAGEGLLDIILANDHFPPLEPDANYVYVRVPESNETNPKALVITTPLVDDTHGWRHHSAQLAQAIMKIFYTHREQSLITQKE